VNKDQFINVLQHFGSSSAAEAQQVLSLKEDFPYSQMLHTLAARLSRDHGFSTQQQELQLAAVYASDRGVLKEIMTQSGTVSRAAEKVIIPVTTTPVATQVTSTPSPAVVTNTDPDFDLAEEVINDLDRLHELKHNFEMMFVDVPQVEITPVAQPAEAPEVKPEVKQEVKPEVKPEANTPAQPTEAAAEAPAKPRESSKARKARIVELARQLAAAEEATNPPAEDTTTAKPSRKKKDQPGDQLIEEISSKQELEPTGEKQKEQIELIDHFIKIQPSITSNTREKLNAAPVGDLSIIKNGEFGDNIVSETLVEILLRQGKKDKAIEVLKKLIWKFPQKKTYFAAQIEELKK
jgi:hypothetical protein